MIRPFDAIAALLVCMALYGCTSQPSQTLASNEVEKRLDEGRKDRVQLVDFKKTDGQSGEILGVKIYVMNFSAAAEFRDDALYTAGGTLMQPDVSLKTQPVGQGPRSCAQDLSACFSQPHLRANKGDRIRLSGTATFERRESGWHVARLVLSLPDGARITDRSVEAGVAASSQMADVKPQAAADQAAIVAQAGSTEDFGFPPRIPSGLPTLTAVDPRLCTDPGSHVLAHPVAGSSHELVAFHTPDRRAVQFMGAGRDNALRIFAASHFDHRDGRPSGDITLASWQVEPRVVDPKTVTMCLFADAPAEWIAKTVAPVIALVNASWSEQHALARRFLTPIATFPSLRPGWNAVDVTSFASRFINSADAHGIAFVGGRTLKSEDPLTSSVSFGMERDSTRNPRVLFVR